MFDDRSGGGGAPERRGFKIVIVDGMLALFMLFGVDIDILFDIDIDMILIWY